MTLAGLTVNETELDGLLSALELLKRCGGKTEDERQIWCLDWLRTTTRMTTSKISASNAKAALTRMKALKKVMDILSGSLANAIMQVTETTAHVVRAVGFSSLPDDVIARVFELYHEEMHHSNMSGDIIHSPQHLASICTRFRRIALHLPHLWEDVSSLFSQDWISCLQGRSQTSEVFINQYYGTSKTVEEALQQIRPTNEWKGLYVYYQGAKSGRKIFQRICPTSGGKFRNLRSLSIEYDRDDFFDEDDLDDVDIAEPTTLLSASDDTLLSEWRLPAVEFLELKNILPRALSCPSLKHLTIDLNRNRTGFYWEIDALNDLFRQMEFIESLTLRFYRANTFLDEEPRGASRPVFLSFLKTLSLEIRSRTQKDLLRRVMNMIDAPNASKMSIYMKYDSVGDRVGPEEWISGLFESPDGMIRTFPNVEELEVVIQDLSCILLPYYKLLRAVPRVRTLSFDTPSRVSAPMIRNIGHSYGCLRDLRSLRIKNCAGGGMHDVEMLVRYFQELEKRNELERFEKLELEGCSKFSEFKHKFENLLESRFVWKD